MNFNFGHVSLHESFQIRFYKWLFLYFLAWWLIFFIIRSLQAILIIEFWRFLDSIVLLLLLWWLLRHFFVVSLGLLPCFGYSDFFLSCLLSLFLGLLILFLLDLFQHFVLLFSHLFGPFLFDPGFFEGLLLCLLVKLGIFRFFLVFLVLERWHKLYLIWCIFG